MPYVLARNEQAMVHAASGYARQKNRLSTWACTASVGPGSTNMVTGAALATINRLPVLLLPGDVFATRVANPVLQELEDPTSLDVSVNDTFKPVSRFWDRINRPEQLVSSALAAMRVLTDPAETGAVTLALPQDVQAEAYDWPEEFFAKRVWHVRRAPAEADTLAQAADLLRGARRPLIVSGGGTIYAEATDALRELAEATGVPVAETQAGKGSLPYDHPQSLGAIGATGTTAANAIARDADVVLGVGTRWSDFTTASRSLFAEDARFVNLNVASVDAFKHAGLPLVADARDGLWGLRGALEGWSADADHTERATKLAAEWDATVEAAYTLGHGPLPAQSEVLGVVNRVSGPRDVVVCAAGSMPGDLHKLWRTRDPKGYHVEYGFSCMGYEIAGGLGVKLAAPDREVFVMVGDGSFLMMAQEIVTAVQEGVKLNIVLVQNHGFASIGALSESLGSQRFGTKYRTREDLAAVAEGLGADRAPRDDARRARGRPARRDRRHRRADRDRPARARAQLRGVVGRAGGRGLRPRLHARRARDLRGEQADPAAVPEPARESHAMTTVDLKTIQHRIGGAETAGTSTRTSPIWDPATGGQQAQVLLAEPADVDAAVAAARKAFESWKEVSVVRRSRVMFAFRNLVEQHADELARIVASEHGKVVEDAKGEVIRGMEVAEYACGMPQLVKGEYSDQVSTDVDSFSFRQPLGVCAGITPFNFPVMVPMWMHPMAIATGNTFVLKPSERDPSASNFIAELYAEAGLPDGVFNVVHGDKVAVDAILDHPDIDAVSFVGSTPIAQYVHGKASASGKRVQALGGAKNHAVVMPDADLDFAAKHLTAAGFGSAGQRCMAIAVAVAVGDAAEPLIERLKQQAEAIKVGPGLEPDSEMGPVVTAQARERIVGYIDGDARPTWSSTAASSRSRATASSSARRCSTTSRPRWTSTATRSSGRCSRSCASTRSPRRSS